MEDFNKDINIRGDYEFIEEKGTWKGLKVWYVKPRLNGRNIDAIPHFLLSDGTSFRYELTPEESFELLNHFGNEIE